MTTCGQCIFAKQLTPPNANKRLCYGGPPQVIALQVMTQEAILGEGGRVITGKDGKPVMRSKPAVQINNVRPIVDIAELACSMFSLATDTAEVQAIISGNKKAPGDDGREPSMFQD